MYLSFTKIKIKVFNFLKFGNHSPRWSFNYFKIIILTYWFSVLTFHLNLSNNCDCTVKPIKLILTNDVGLRIMSVSGGIFSKFQQN